jgi:hypothetical protein
MFRRLALTAALFAFAGLLPSYSAAAPVPAAQAAVVAQSLPPLFDTESATQAHCPKDVVVWLNIPAAFTIAKASDGTGTRSTALMLVKRKQSP